MVQIYKKKLKTKCFSIFFRSIKTKRFKSVNKRIFVGIILFKQKTDYISNKSRKVSIEVQKITKTYGTEVALNEISFSVRRGEIVGFLGANGAGKSTLMKIITTYVNCDSGEVWIDGINTKKEPLKVQRLIGYLPEHNPLYLDSYVREYLSFSASIFNVNSDRIEEVIQLTGLMAEANKKIGQLSKGYRQRVGIANSLLHDPQVLILDEPTTGLDPNQLIEIRQLIRNIGKSKTVFFSTHIMQEVEAICDRVIIIKKGVIVANKKLSEISQNSQQIIEVEFNSEIERQDIENIPNLLQSINIHDFVWELTFDTKKDMRASIFDFANNNGLKILQLNQKNKTIETIFREITK